MEEKYCTICEETKPLKKFTLNPDGSVRKHVCKSCYGKKWRAQLKLEMLTAFGGKCQCCGETNPYFLTLDHINNDGAEHRAQFESRNNEQIYADAKREGWPKDKYQLLCMNCNFAKAHYGGCPNERGITTEDVIKELKAKVFHTGKKLQDYSNNAGLKMGPISLRQRAQPTLEELKAKFKLASPEQIEKILGHLQSK